MQYMHEYMVLNLDLKPFLTDVSLKNGDVLSKYTHCYSVHTVYQCVHSCMYSCMYWYTTVFRYRADVPRQLSKCTQYYRS